MQFRSAIAVAAAFLLSSLGWSASSTSHPYFDDHGALEWTTRLADAQARARAEGKVVLIEYGRPACGACRAIVQNVIPDARIRARVADLCVGLAAACDPPEEERTVAELMDEHLPGARALPFVAFVTPDRKWIAGFSGYRNVADFEAMLAKVEASPALAAAPDVAATLDGLAADAARAAQKGDWKSVIGAARSARTLKGRSPARARLAASEASARAFARDALAKAADTVRTGGDRKALRTALDRLSAAFTGEPEGIEAQRGTQALERLGTTDALPSEERPAAREKAARDFAGSAWAAWFSTAAR